jgi:hypothetical protein
MSFFCLSIEDIAACSMNFISTCASTLSLDDSQYGAFVTAMKSKLALI